MALSMLKINFYKKIHNKYYVSNISLNNDKPYLFLTINNLSA